VRLEGCFNFRDLGGYATRDGRHVRWRRLYRSDALHHLSDADLRHVRDELGVRTIVDLRSSAERSGEPTSPLAAPPVQVHHVPLFDRERSGSTPSLPLADIYLMLLRFAREPIANAVRVLASSNEPALFHCAAGKDRTGIVAAVLLGALGVRDEDIVEDYAATKQGLVGIVERLRGSDSYQYVFTELPPDTLHAEPETMARVLKEAGEEYGSMRRYLMQAGLGDAELRRLEESLLDER
jgi:protein-tyrosine phosphatase